MANLHSGDASCFKLFGKVIQPDTHPHPHHHHHKDHDDDAGVAAAEEAAAAPTPSGIEQTAALPCPRCGSRETKFCYFNNHNARQPRHLCRSCRRYWTAGGALRRVASASGRRRARSYAAAAVTRATEGKVGMETVDS